MKRARKGSFSRSTVSKRRPTDNSENKRVISNDNKYSVNENEKRDLQMKYYGKVMEDGSQDTENTLFAQGNDIPDAEKQPEQNDVKEGDDVPVEQTAENSAAEETMDENNVQEDNVTSDNTNEKLYASDEENTKKKVKPEGKKKFVLIFAISLAVFICFSVLAFGLSGFFDKKSLYNDMNVDYMEPVDEVTGKINVLLLGVDNEGLRTDTIMVASYDTDDHVMNILSIPRDTRMYVGSKYQKINAAHAITGKDGKIAGPQGSIEAVTRITGIPINYYVEFSFEAFRETIDALGGVYYNVPQNMNYEDPTQKLYIHLTSGYQLLDGDKAEQLVRFRQYPQGDIKRVEVQQSFIKALAEQKMNSSIITKLPDLYKTLTKHVKTNFSLSDITKYGPSLLELSMENVYTYSLPGEYSGSEYAASYWIADMNATKQLIETTFGYDATKITNKKAGEYLTFTEPTETVTEDVTPTALPSEKASSKPTASAKASTKPSAKPSASASATPEASEEPEESKKPEDAEEAEKTEEPTQTEKPSSTSSSAAAPSFGVKPGTIINAQEGGALKEVLPPSSYGDIAKTPTPTKTPAPAKTATPAPVKTAAPTATPSANTSSGVGGRPQANQ